MRSGFMRLLLASILIVVVPHVARTQAVDIQKIKNLKSQQTNIENRIADLQSQIDDAFAGKTYCTSGERQEDLRRLRALQREILALRGEYADFKAGFIKLAATPTAGPQFDAVGIRPDERSYWTADDNALQKLRDSAFAKADRVERALIVDCSDKKTAPTKGLAVGSAPPKAAGHTQSGTTKVTPPSSTGTATPPAGPLPGAPCTDRQRTEARLRLQDELLRLQAELIPIDGTTPQGRARQLQLLREIERVRAMMDSDCPPLPATTKPLVPAPAMAVDSKLSTPDSKAPATKADQPKEKPIPPKINLVDDLVEPPTSSEVRMLRALVKELDETTRAYPNLIEGCQPGIWDKHIAQLEAIAKRARQIAEWAKAPGQTTGVDPSEAQRLAEDAQKAVDAAKRGKAANGAQWGAADCPHYAPPPPKEEPKTSSSHSAVPKTPAQELGAIQGSLMGFGLAFQEGGICDPEKWTAAIAHLEDEARRAQEIADAVRAGGAYSSITPEKAQKEADMIRRTVDAWKAHPPKGCGGTTTVQLSPFATEILSVHNVLRTEYGAPLLRWDETLAQHARDYAQELAGAGQLSHASREGRGIERENLSEGNLGWTTVQMLNSWVGEKRNFIPGLFPNVARDGNWLNVAHYTQMIWPTTTDLGCSEATGSGHKWLVCRYSPGGNKDGKPVGQPVAPKTCAPNTATRRAPAKPASKDDGPFKIGIQYEFAGTTCSPYQDTKVKQPELPKQETFKPAPSKPGEIDPM